MANGYIGKISALVTANTSDLSRKLSGAVGDVDKFANKLNASITRSANAAGASFDKIFTPLQRLERQFSTALKLNLRTEEQVQKLRQLVSVSEQVAKPLEKAAANTTKLSAAVAGEFQPALIKSQAQVKLLETAIDRFGSVSEKSFLSVQRRVEQTDAATRRLLEAQSLVSGLATGGELRFQQPALAQQAARAAELQQQAAQLSPEQIQSSGIASIVGRQRQATEEAERLLAVLENIRLTRSGDASAAEAAYGKQVGAVRLVNDELERQIAITKKAESAAQKAADNEVALLIRRNQAGKEIERQRLAQRDARAIAEFRPIPGNPTGQFGPEPPSVPLTRNRNPRQRVLDNLGGEVDVLRRRVGALGDPLRETIGPAVDRLTTRFQNLARAGVGFTADEAKRLSREVASVNSALASRKNISSSFEKSFGGAGSFGLGLGVDEKSLRGVGAEIEYVQGRLARLGQAVRGPVLDALDAFRSRAIELFKGGALDTSQGRRELELLRQGFVKALSAAGGGSERRITDGLRRAGDVTRGGADKAQLAIQQAAFALDDFFSVTGGLDQRIRAAGNNISQLGFIIGGTTGLVVGIAASIGGQLISALAKWANGGRSTENMTKALNDAMERQKSITQELATAFQSLGDTIASRGFSPATAAANEFSEKLKEINKLQAQAAESSLAATSQGVQDARGSQNAIKERLDGETNIGRRIALIRQLAEAQRNERDITQRVAAGPASPLRLPQIGPREDFVGNNAPIAGRVPAGQEIAAFFERVAREAEQRAAGRQGFRKTQDDISGSTVPEFRAAATQLRDFARNLDLGNSAQSISSQADAIQEAIELFKGAASRTALSFSTEAANEASAFIKAFEELRQRILAGFNEQTNATINESLTTADAASKRLEEAQKAVQESIQQGVDGSEGLAANLDEISASIKRSTDAINQAIQGVDGQGRTIERTPAQVRAIAERERRNTARQLEDATGARDEIARRAEAARFERTVNPQRRTQAIVDQAQQNLSSAGAETGAIARRLREIQFEREGLQKARKASEPQSNEAIDRQVRELLAASDALRRFTEALNAAASEAASNLGSAQQRADEARRADLGRSTPDTIANRAQADRDLREQQQANARVQDAIAAERARVEQQALNGVGPLAGVFERLQSIKEETDAGNVSVQRQLELIAERRRLEEQVNAEIAKGNAVTAARDASTGINERQAAEGRGRELSLTPAQRAARDMQQGVSDINAYFDAMAKNIRESKQGIKQQSSLLQNERQRQAAQAQFERDQLQQNAPMLFDMAEQSRNAVLQGPSRAALGASDASTTQGQAELNRLIRGDDAARDVNLAELQRQTQLLRQIANKPGAPVAN